MIRKHSNCDFLIIIFYAKLIVKEVWNSWSLQIRWVDFCDFVDLKCCYLNSLVKFDLVSVILEYFNQLKIYSFVSLCCDAFPKIQGQEQGTLIKFWTWL